MDESLIKFAGDKVVMSKKHYEIMKKTYDAYQKKKEQARISMSKKYHEQKRERQKNALKEKELTDQEVEFILKHTN